MTKVNFGKYRSVFINNGKVCSFSGFTRKTKINMENTVFLHN